jgi:hypothetical protein
MRADQLFESSIAVLCSIPIELGRYTSGMSVRNAAFLAFAGMILVSALRTFALFSDLFAIVRGLIPAIQLFTSLIYTFASLCVTVFFYVFYKKA